MNWAYKFNYSINVFSVGIYGLFAVEYNGKCRKMMWQALIEWIENLYPIKKTDGFRSCWFYYVCEHEQKNV